MARSRAGQAPPYSKISGRVASQLVTWLEDEIADTWPTAG